MSFIEKAHNLEERIDKKIASYHPRDQDFFQFLAVIFFIVGFMLFVYCFLHGYHPMKLEQMSSPVLYLGLGLICSIFFIFAKKGKL